MKQRWAPCVLLVCLGCLPLVWAGEKTAAAPETPAHAAAIAKLLEPIRVQHDIPGMAAAVVSSKGLLALGVTGVRRAGADVVATTNDLWHIGSNTMWHAVAWLAPKKDFAVLITCNLGGDPGAKACDAAAGALIRWHASRSRR